MKKMTCGEIAKACHGTFIGPKAAEERIVAGIALDSRKIEKDWVFVATVGERVDGHSFIPQVYQKQAACVISEKILEEPAGAYIHVQSSFQALKDIAAYYRSLLETKVIGVTGSVGKTSTKEMIASVLQTQYCVQKTAGNYNNEVGLPLTIFTIGKEHDAAVLEMGISDFGEMHRLGAVARPDLMVLTNIGQCHLENLKDRDGVLRAKTEVFAEMDENAQVILNGDDDKLCTISEVHGRRPYFFSKNQELAGQHGINPDAYATDIQNLGLHGSKCVIHIGEEQIAVTIPLPGEHMIWNALAAAMIGKLLGLRMEQIVEGISKVEAVGGRSHMIETEDYTILDDCYNANPVSMEAALDLLAYAQGRKVAVMGDMFELGEQTEQLHKQTGSYAAQKEIDVIICIGRLAAQMAEGAREAGAKAVYHFDEKEDFLRQAAQLLQHGDAVLLKASHGMHFEELLKGLETLN